MKQKQYNYLFAILYSIFLVGITVFFIMKTFIIAETYSVVENTTSTQSSKTSTSSSISSKNTLTDTGEITSSDDSYSDDHIQIDISTIEKYDTTIYIADIYIDDISYLQSAFAKNSYGRNISETTSTQAENNNALLAINGDYYGFRNNGYVIRDGVLYRDSQQSSTQEDLVIYNNGSFGIIREGDITAQELLNNGAWQVYSFGPGLIEDGEITVGENEEISGKSMNSNPRTAIGMIETGHYIFVVSDGRTTASAGLSLYELATIMQDYGATVAYNLDGGGSSTMVFDNSVVNQPTSGHGITERAVSDIIYIGY